MRKHACETVRALPQQSKLLIRAGQATHSRRIASRRIVEDMDTAIARRTADRLRLPQFRKPAGAHVEPTGSDVERPSALGPIDATRWRDRPRREQLGFAALILGTLAFWLYGLSANGYANSFYSAAVQAGSHNWEAFLFGSSDAANSITVDKPPASLWFMALSVRLFGLNSWAILVPEVLMGVATVALVYYGVRRYFGHAAGLLSGLVLALTPVATLMFRFNNPDALLALLLTAACVATMRALEKANPRWLIAVGALLGFGFLTKTLQAFLIVPVLGLVYLVAAPTTLRTRITHSLAALLAMIVAGGWWVAIVELVPASMRPYIGGSQNNSFLELTFGYNGLGRISGEEAGSVGPNMGTESIWRMFSSSVGGQISWFIPSALLLLIVGLWVSRKAPRTDLVRASYLVWGGSMVVTGLVFSLMAGIFHEYYTVALAPYIAAVIGIGATQAWSRAGSQRERWGSIALAAATAMAATWSFFLLTRVDAYGPLRYVVFAVGMAAALLLLVTSRLHRRFVPVVLAAALLSSLAGPAAYSVSTVTKAATGSIVTAGPSSGMGGPGGMGGGMGQPPAMPGQGTNGTTSNGTTSNGTSSTTDGQTNTPGGMGGGMSGLLNATTANTEVVAALQANASDYTWVAAAIGSQNAAGLQLGSDEPVMAIGGFNGSDPSPTLAQFQQYVKNGQIHYFLAGGGFGGSNGGSSSSSEISTWVQANYTTVTIGGTTFYDLTAPLS